MFNIGIFAGPAMILARFLKIFPSVKYVPLFIFTGLFTILSVFQYLFSKKHPFSHATKYISLASLEFLIAFLSTTPGLSLYISYVFVPFTSCMYYNKRFTRNMCISCYLVMIFTFYIRSLEPVPLPAPSTITGIRWFAAYGFGATIEYAVCSVIAYFISKTARETLDKQFDQDTQIKSMQSQLIAGFANLVESKDPTTGEHVKRTSTYVELISKKLRELGYYTKVLTDEMIANMVKAAPLHDIGKMQISDAILTKPGRLTKEEYDVIQQHTLYGEKIIEQNLTDVEDATYTQIAEEMALCHHEWWNGNGYPFHFIGPEIPLSARIMAAADVLDALLTIRPYKDAIPLDDTLIIMENLSGTQFDPAVIEAVLSLKKEIAASIKK